MEKRILPITLTFLFGGLGLTAYGIFMHFFFNPEVTMKYLMLSCYGLFGMWVAMLISKIMVDMRKKD